MIREEQTTFRSPLGFDRMLELNLQLMCKIAELEMMSRPVEKQVNTKEVETKKSDSNNVPQEYESEDVMILLHQKR